MRTFLETYGVAIFTLVLMAILIAFATPLGKIIKNVTNNQVANVDRIGTQEIEKTNVEATDYVYACLYNNGELVLSSREIKNKENVMQDYGYTNTHPWTGTEKTPNLTVKTVTFLNVVKLTNCSYLFTWCIELESINNMECLDTSECTNMMSMFYQCKKLKMLDLSNFNTKTVQNMNCMFVYCTDITTLDLSSFDTSNVVNMNYMFDCCTNLKFINLSSFNTSKVQGMQDIFLNCFNLTALDLSSFDTKNCTNMNNMFLSCYSLRTITVSDTWDTSHATTKYMFWNCGTDHVTQK